MTHVDLVRASRDGDQFHYLWAARQCLPLLNPTAELAAVSIEGPSTEEGPPSAADAGDEVVDVGLYYGSEEVSKATRISYIQLKHSTAQTAKEWTGSGLKTAIAGFAKRFSYLTHTLGIEHVRGRVTFQFVTNRPVAPNVIESLQDLALGHVPRHATVASLLSTYAGSKPAELTEFFKLFTIDAGVPDLWNQRNLLAESTAIYLSDPDYDAADQLVALVTKRALSESKTNPTVRREDVLRALKVSSNDLYPAPCELEAPNFDLPRLQDAEVLRTVLESDAPVIIHAEGGIGKSNVARKVAAAMPPGSQAVLYDCFGNGLYRNGMHLRHRHRDALVQIGNELASRGLCHPLIPSSHSDDKQILRALHARLVQAISFMRASVPDASLCLIIDAADNASMAAEEFSQSSFVRDLMSLPLPVGIRLAFTCRSHRQHLLHPIASAVRFELQPFSLEESASHLRRHYPDATDGQASEFAVLSSQNPRVQAIALSFGLPLEDMLKRLGPTPTDVDRTIADLLNGAVAKLRDDAGIEAEQVDIICSCLSMLRPLIPISVLARIAGTTENAIRSFAFDLGRPLLVKGDSLHFLDEPSETWFREKFKPDHQALQGMLRRLRPLASSSAYASALLPQFLLDAGHLDELLDLALSDRDLPINNPIARRDVELQRLLFALKAALVGKRYPAAAKLALRAAGVTAAEFRQNKLVQKNTDLAARLLDVDRVEEVVSRRTFSSTWMGSSNAYYAGLLSGKGELLPLAAGRLRSANDWLQVWGRAAREALENDERPSDEVSDEDRAELTLAELRINGADSAARHLRAWSPKSLSYSAGRIVAARLYDQGDAASADALFDAAGNNVWLLLAIASESDRVQHQLPRRQLERLLKLLSSSHVMLTENDSYYSRWKVLAGVVAAIELALLCLPSDKERWARLLSRYLPASPPYELAPRHDGVSSPLLRAYAIHAELTGEALTLRGLAPERLKDKIDEHGKVVGYDTDAESFCRDIGAVLGWFVLEARWICGTALPSETSIGGDELSRLSTAESRRYYENSALSQTVAVQWLSMLIRAGQLKSDALVRYESWFESTKKSLWPTTLTEVCRVAARAKELESFTLTTGAYAFERIEALTEEGAESRVEMYTDLARSIVSLSPEEAAAYFDRAMVISGRIGDETRDRWNALVHLAKRAGDPKAPRPELTYRFAQAAELTNVYVDKGFDWRGTIEAMAGICGSSLLAIFSRWRDRNSVDHKYLVPIVAQSLVSSGKLPEQTLIALAGIDAQWGRISDLEAVVSSTASTEAKARAIQTAYRYIRVQPQSKAAWKRIRSLAEPVGIKLLDAERLERLAKDDPGSTESKTERAAAGTVGDAAAPPSAWMASLDGVDLTDPLALKVAWREAKAMERGASFLDFFDEVMQRAGTAKAAATISAMVSWGDLKVFEVRLLLEAVTPNQRRLQSVQAALRAAVLDLCRREPQGVARRGRNAYLPLERLHIERIVPDTEVVDALLMGYTDAISGADAETLFQLLDSLSATLSSDEAASALDYGLGLLQEALVDEKGDGAWTDVLRPPQDILSALGGYIWSGLAAPTAAVRWEFAHVVRNVVELGWDGLLDRLAEHWTLRTAGPFGDHRLAFYAFHARQWLIIGLVRGARERGSLPASILSLLREELKTPHVLIRGFAAQALLCVGAAGDAVEQARLKDINASKFPEKVVSSYQDANEGARALDEFPPEEDFHFGIDIGPYWFAPLGRGFGLGQNAIERRARRAIVRELGLKPLSHANDARYSQKVFSSRSSDTHHSHGERPKIDDLRAYASYHAMMVVAAELLNERATLSIEDEQENRFSQWLRERGLSRGNGWWLSDLRDPQMTHLASLETTTPGADWYWSATRDYLDAQLRTDDGALVVWGEWGFGRTSNSESISISSAVTNLKVGPALLAALQTANHERFFLPTKNEWGEEPDACLPLSGWVDSGDGWALLDEQDPWAAGLRYPEMAPSESLVQRMSLELSADGRSWTSPNGAKLRGESWSRHVGYGNDAGELPGGRLLADAAFLDCLLSEDDACLIVQVRVRVRVERRGGQSEGVEMSPWPYSRYYLIDRHGKTRTL